MTKAAEYLRMSTDHQRYSLENQRALLARFASERGIEIVASYVDAGKSGVTAMKRDGLSRLLADVIAGDPGFSVVLVLDVSRWGRFQDPDEAAHYEFVCKAAGVGVVYCAEVFENDGTNASAIMKQIKRVMAAEYSQQLSARSAAGKYRAARAGHAVGGAPSYGTRRQVVNADGSAGRILETGERKSRSDQHVRLVPGPPEELEAIRVIFGRFLGHGAGMSSIAFWLNARGSTFANGKSWTYERVRSVLTNETAIGNMTVGKRTGPLGGRSALNPPASWVRVPVTPPLVTMARYHRAQRQLALMKGQRVTTAEIVRQLRRLLKIQGYLSCQSINASPITPRADVYKRRFGSLTAAYETVGYRPVVRHRRRAADWAYKNERIVEGLKRLLSEQGFLSLQLIHADRRLPSPSCIVERFGCLTAAYVLAGYNLSHGEKIRASIKRRMGESPG